MGYSQLRTKHGYPLDEVVSAFQKSLRRGLEEDALYWGAEMYVSGFEGHAWSRILIIGSEDVGVAEPGLPANLWALYQMYDHFKKKGNKHKPERLHFFHAIMLLARAKKSRNVDTALGVVLCELEKEEPNPEICPRKEMPDYALDCHTMRGRMQRRDSAHFYAHAAVVANKGLEDPYYERALKADRCGIAGDVIFEEDTGKREQMALLE